MFREIGGSGSVVEEGERDTEGVGAWLEVDESAVGV
jgi:hypothetical protein